MVDTLVESASNVEVSTFPDLYGYYFHISRKSCNKRQTYFL